MSGRTARKRPRGWSRVSGSLGPAPYFLLGAAALGVIGLGWVGWMQTDPTLSPVTALYRTIALFTIAMPDGVDEVAPTLEVARWAAIGVAAASIFTIVRSTIREVRLRRQVQRARRSKSHVVVRGDGAEAVQIALSFAEADARRRVVLIGAAPESRHPELRDARVLTLSGVNDADLAAIVGDAHRVVVVAPTDDEAMAEANRIGELRTADIPVTLLLDDRDLAARWNRTRSETALSRPFRIATGLLSQHPPLEDDALAAPPVVFGDGAVAVEIARRIVTGWQDPGERLRVHLVSDSSRLAESSSVGLEARGEFVPHVMGGYAELAPEVLRRILEEAPADDRGGKVTFAGPRVYVAYRRSELTLTVAAALAEAVPEAHVVGVVPDAAPWAEGRQELEVAEAERVASPRTGGLHLVSTDEVLTDPAAIEEVPSARLADQILAEARRWPSEVPTLLQAAADPAELARSIAEDAAAVLAAGGLLLDAGAAPARRPPVLGPRELSAVADALGARLPVGREVERIRLLEFAARLPTLAARAGHTPDWAPGHRTLLDGERLEALALLAHEGYLGVAARTGNATRSPNHDRAWGQLSDLDRRSNLAQAVDIPVKLALLGLDWRESEKPVATGFSDEEIESLWPHEHRRWRHFQIRNGRRGRDWDVPDDRLEPGQIEYDRSAVRAVPSALAAVGIEIVRPGA